MSYQNIINALQANSGEGLSPQMKSDNYAAFNKIMEQGIYLPDLLKKVDALEAEIKEMKKPKDNGVDAQLFSVMEQAVKDDPKVTEAKRRLQEEKTRIISELCMSKESYRQAFDDYRTAVNASYIAMREKSSR